jgi:hypothetical protein
MRENVVVLCLSTAACLRAPLVVNTSVPLPTHEQPSIPDGCAQSFSGLWHHATHRQFQYQADDDAGQLTFRVTLKPATQDPPRRLQFFRDPRWPRLVPFDAGEGDLAPSNMDRGRIVLERTSRGFIGMTLLIPDGGLCTSGFPTRVVGCATDELELETATLLSVETCAPIPESVATHRIVRETRSFFSPRDGGLDAGQPSWVPGQ